MLILSVASGADWSSLGSMDTRVIQVGTERTPGIFDLTSVAAEFAAEHGDGLLSVFAPHATAGVALIEMGAGSDDDLLAAVNALLPADDRWRHAHGSTGHGRDHVLPAFISPSLTIPVVEGNLALGTWQYLVLVDPNRDNPQRKVRLSFIPA